MCKKPRAFLFVAVCVLWAGSLPRAGIAQDATSAGPDEQLLKEAGLPIDGAGLLEFFRARSRLDADRDRLLVLVRQLGAPAAEVRDRPAWPCGAPCALPQVSVKGQAGVEIDLNVAFASGCRHLPRVPLRRAG